MNQTEHAWAAKTKDVAGFASPWVTKPHVRARAYPTALNFSDALKGFKGKRRDVMFHMANRGEAGKTKCAFCGGKLSEPAKAVTRAVGDDVTVVAAAGTKAEEFSTWMYYAKSKTFSKGLHYVCSWSYLFGQVAKLREAA